MKNHTWKATLRAAKESVQAPNKPNWEGLKRKKKKKKGGSEQFWSRKMPTPS